MLNGAVNVLCGTTIVVVGCPVAAIVMGLANAVLSLEAVALFDLIKPIAVLVVLVIAEAVFEFEVAALVSVLTTGSVERVMPICAVVL